jgi:hypothetical protein
MHDPIRATCVVTRIPSTNRSPAHERVPGLAHSRPAYSKSLPREPYVAEPALTSSPPHAPRAWGVSARDYDRHLHRADHDGVVYARPVLQRRCLTDIPGAASGVLWALPRLEVNVWIFKAEQKRSAAGPVRAEQVSRHFGHTKGDVPSRGATFGRGVWLRGDGFNYDATSSGVATSLRSSVVVWASMRAMEPSER